MQYVIYKITCNSPDIDHVYVGSTKRFENRQYDHKFKSLNEKCTFKLYTTIRDHGGFDNWTFEAVETGTCKTNFEKRSRERFFWEELNADLNSIRPQASKEEIRLDNLETMKQYYKNNLEKIKLNGSNKVHCDACNGKFRKNAISAHNKTQKHLKNLELNNSVSKSDL